jgi:hypothetical protein
MNNMTAKRATAYTALISGLLLLDDLAKQLLLNTGTVVAAVLIGPHDVFQVGLVYPTDYTKAQAE